MRFVVLSFALLLTACTLVPPPEQQTTASGARVEDMPIHDSQAPVVVVTGSLLPTTQMLPSGVLEIGNAEAPHTLIVFTEFHCAYCAEFQQEQLPLLLSDYVDTNELKIQIVPFVLAKYPNSTDGAKGALCAGEQGKAMEMQNTLFKNPSKHQTSILAYAKELELDSDAITNCMTNEHTTTLLNEQKAWAESLGVELVPTFFLDGEKFVGLPYYADLRGRIESALEK